MNDPLVHLEARLQASERRTFARTLIAMGVPIGAAAVILAVMVGEIHQRSGELQVAQTHLETLDVQRKQTQAAVSTAQGTLVEVEERAKQAEQRAQAAEAKATQVENQLHQLEASVREAAHFNRHVRPLDWVLVKYVASRSQDAGRIFATIVQDRDRGLSWSHKNQEGLGYTSPGYAGHVLQELGRLPRDQAPAPALKALQVHQGQPQDGDVVLYEGGYAMFYFTDSRGVALVVGMTPLGITALSDNFGPRRLGYVRT